MVCFKSWKKVGSSCKNYSQKEDSLKENLLKKIFVIEIFAKENFAKEIFEKGTPLEKYLQKKEIFWKEVLSK